MGEASTFVVGTRFRVVATLLHSQAAASDGLRPYPDGLRPYPDGGFAPILPTLRAYARRGGIKLNIIIVHASIQAMRGLRPLKLPLTKDPLKWSIEATWRTQLTNRSAGQNVTDNHSDHHLTNTQCSFSGGESGGDRRSRRRITSR